MRLDIEKLRKAAGMSQRRLAELLQVRPSFLSAIENGRSRLPDDKLDKIRTIFADEELDRFMIADDDQEPVVPPHTHTPAETGLDRLEELEQRNDSLLLRNDRLSDRIDDLREQVDELLRENYRLKELLTLNRISYCSS